MKIALLLFLCVTTLANGAGKSTPVPAAPPMKASPPLDVFGLKLGSPPTIQECTSSWLGRAYSYNGDQSDDCWKYLKGNIESRTPLADAELIIVLKSLNNHLFSNRLLASAIGGKLESISLSTDGVEGQVEVFAELTKKYGAPTTKEISKVKTRVGVEYDSLTAEWQFTDLIVTQVGTSGKVTSGVVIIQTTIGAAAAKAEREARHAAETKL